MTTTNDDRIRQVIERHAWNICWRCRVAFAYDDLRYSGTDSDGNWRFECQFCRQGKRLMIWSGIDRARAALAASIRFAEALDDERRT